MMEFALIRGAILVRLMTLPVSQPKRLAVTMGDPAGVGPEVCLQLVQRRESMPGMMPVIYGDPMVLERVAHVVGLPMAPYECVNPVRSLTDPLSIVPARVEARCGQAAYAYLATAIEDALAGVVDAIVTAPLNKEALHAAGFPYPGHTEILTALTQSTKTCMLQVSDEVTASFVTCHCGYAEAPRLLTRERLRDVIDLTGEAVRKIRNRPKDSIAMVVLGLNPHAGEHGLFGHGEEERIILPEVEAARLRGWNVQGPIPPDTAFIPSKRQQTDAFICMYHDQGHIPLKALAFDSAVNVTLGLPIIRTSVDHGTAFDIAWKGRADPGSLLAAAQLAVDLAG